MTASRHSAHQVIALLMAAAVVATACTQSPTASSAPSAAASATDAPQKGGTVIEAAANGDIATLQPILAVDGPSLRVSSLIYDTIMYQDPKDGAPVAKMATFSVSPDGLTYTFELKPNVNWSDGSPIIAQDWLTGLKAVAKSLKATQKTQYASVVGFNDFKDGKAATISGVTIDGTNPKKWTVKMSSVFCPAILSLIGYTLPTQVFGKYVTESSKPGDIDTAPENIAPTVFSGPFKFKEWRKGDQTILVRNDTYWQGAPNLDQFVYKVVATATGVPSGLKTGELTFGVVQAKDLADVQTVSSLRITKFQNLGYVWMSWNTASPTAIALADKRVRQALAYGLDMDAVIKAVVFGEATKHVAHFVPGQWADPAAATLEQYKFDKAKAIQLLKDAGWTPGPDGTLQNSAGKKFSLTITTYDNQERQTLAQVAVDQYKQLGIDAKTTTENFQGLVTKLQNGDATVEGAIIGWGLSGDPDPYQIFHSSQIPDPAKKVVGLDFTGFKDPALDKAIEEARNPSNGDCSTAARQKQYQTVDKILNDGQPYNFGYVQNTIVVSQNTLQNFAPTSYSSGSYYNAHTWWIKK